MVLEPEVLVLHRRRPIELRAERPRAASRKQGRLGAYRHEGFWQSMDNIRDVRYLRALWDAGRRTLANVGVAGSWSGRTVLVTGRRRPARRRRCRSGSSRPAPRSSVSISPGMARRRRSRSAASGRSTATSATRAALVQLLGDRARRHGHPPRGADPRRARRSTIQTHTFSNNIEGSWSVLEACRATRSVTAIVVASSDKAYGDWSGRPYREEMALRARHPYDVSKAATDLLAQSYAATYGLPVAITRCGNLYGGGDLNWSRIVPGTIRSILERASAGHPVRRHLRPRLSARRRRGRWRALLADAVRDRQASSGARPSTSPAGIALTVTRDRAAGSLRSWTPARADRLGLDLTEIPEQRVSTAKAGGDSRMAATVDLDDGPPRGDRLVSGEPGRP